MKGCPDCKLESEITELIVKQFASVAKAQADRRKARKLAKEIVRIAGSREDRDDG